MSNRKIANEYTNIKKPGAFAGASAFKRELVKRKIKINSSAINDWLLSQDAYTLHRPAINKFRRNRIMVNGIDDTYQIDLVDMSNISEVNDGFKFILMCIDVFSKFGWAIPIKNKSAISVLEAIKTILSSKRIPERIHTDEGKEFLNKLVKNYLNNLHIKLYIINSEMKASVVERFNRTIKEKMWRYFSHNQTNRYVDILQDLIYNYNNSYHRSIKTAPSKVNKSNEEVVWANLYGFDRSGFNSQSINFKFNIGDEVRISKSKAIFAKGYEENWTRETFIVTERIPRVPPVYKIRDTHETNSEPIDGAFYESQLQKVLPPSEKDYYIREVLKSRKSKSGERESLINWLGYPDKFNSWIPNTLLPDKNLINKRPIKRPI